MMVALDDQIVDELHSHRTIGYFASCRQSPLVGAYTLAENQQMEKKLGLFRNQLAMKLAKFNWEIQAKS